MLAGLFRQPGRIVISVLPGDTGYRLVIAVAIAVLIPAPTAFMLRAAQTFSINKVVACMLRAITRVLREVTKLGYGYCVFTQLKGAQADLMCWLRLLFSAGSTHDKLACRDIDHRRHDMLCRYRYKTGTK